MSTKRQQKRAERQAQRTLRRLTREENERLRHQAAINREPYKPTFRGERWMPIPGIDTHEVNNRGNIRRKAQP